MRLREELERAEKENETMRRRICQVMKMKSPGLMAQNHEHTRAVTIRSCQQILKGEDEWGNPND